MMGVLVLVLVLFVQLGVVYGMYIVYWDLMRTRLVDMHR